MIQPYHELKGFHFDKYYSYYLQGDMATAVFAEMSEQL
jgi:hypothetical protein